MAWKLLSEKAEGAAIISPNSRLAEPAIPYLDSVKGKDESKGSYFSGSHLILSCPASLFRGEASSSIGTQVAVSYGWPRGISDLAGTHG